MKTEPRDDRSSPSGSQQRLDSWLWASRFFKTRKLANDAATAGHIAVNGRRAKPAKAIEPGDEIRIRKDHLEYVVTVLELSPRRLGAPLAAALYLESPQSIAGREAKRQAMRDRHTGVRFDRRRPSSRDRRSMVRVKRQDAPRD